MPSKSRLFSQLIAGSGQIKADRLSDDISTIEQVASTEDLTAVGNTIGDQRVINNNLYIWNGSGWYRIALINASPTWDSGGQPNSSYELDADSPQDPTIITLAASDPDGLSISYNYITSGSMDSMATISQDSSVFTITPKTVTEVGEGTELTGSITFRATDGVNILPQVSSFTLNFVTIIENSNYTTLLAAAVDTSDNNNITDASSNSHSITVNGDAHAGTFSPYRSGGYSWDFQGAGFYTNDNGHGESIEAENTVSAFNVGTNDYTIEGWFKERDSETYSTNPNGRLFDLGPNDNISLMRNYPNTGGKKLLLKENSSVIITSTNDVFDGNWHFIQVVRTGGYTKLYVDGTEEGSIASTTNINAISKIIVGAWSDYSHGFDGQIADFRFSNIARSAGVPTERLTSDSNTKLLVCTKPYLVDESGTATSLVLKKSSNGTRDYPDAVAISPYDNLEYSVTDHGGSVYFKGYNDNISATGSSDFAPSTDEFTIKLWYYPKVQSSSVTYLIRQGTDTNTSGYWAIAHYSNGRLRRMERSGSFSSAYSANNAVKIGQWNYVEFYQNGANTGEIKVNGVSVLTGANYLGNTDDLQFGSSVGSDADLYLSDIQIIKGSDGRESSVPTAPMSSVSNTKLHIKGTDASIIDKSQGANLKLVGNTTGSTTQVKFANTRSMYFDASGDYIDISEGFIPLRTSDFTIETWFYPTANPSNHEGIFSNGTHNSGNWLALLYQTNRIIRYDIGGGSSSNLSTTAVSLNNWHHIALCRSGGNIRLYINGIQEHTEANSSDLGYETARIGERIGLSGYALNSAYLQDFRITKGLARYTANFTPPTASLKG